MTVNLRAPDDDTILDMIRAGVNTIPTITEKCFGTLHGQDLIDGKTRILKRLNSMSKWGMVRKTTQTTIRKYCNRAYIWEVIE